jgi:hypothetical protein
MAIRKLVNSGTNTTGTKSSVFVDTTLSDFQAISTTTVTSGGASEIVFSSIPQYYKHLQIRGIGRTAQSGSGGSALGIQFNSDTGSNYSSHRYYANGTGTGSNDSSGGLTNTAQVGNMTASGNDANLFAPNIIDIVDYTGTNNKKVCRSLSGTDFGSSGAGYPMYIHLTWNNTNAITSIRLYHTSGNNLSQHTSFTLYGLRG